MYDNLLNVSQPCGKRNEKHVLEDEKVKKPTELLLWLLLCMLLLAKTKENFAFNFHPSTGQLHKKCLNIFGREKKKQVHLVKENADKLLSVSTFVPNRTYADVDSQPAGQTDTGADGQVATTTTYLCQDFFSSKFSVFCVVCHAGGWSPLKVSFFLGSMNEK